MSQNIDISETPLVPVKMLYQLENPRYDSWLSRGIYASCTVIAESEEVARRIHPNSVHDPCGCWNDYIWCYPSEVIVTQIGIIADCKINKGVVGSIYISNDR
jgi:hypothetical protein